LETIITATCDRYGHMVALFLVIDPFTSVRLTIEQFQLDMITSHSGSVELWCQGL